ncbi:MAG: iron-only hydrogenase system regulator [Desulfovibrionaceae bacterium]|nr:iron-only hydrogenase system regulator [Desulfovibrionaceae bacterium]
MDNGQTKRIGIIGVVIKDREKTGPRVNELLSQYARIIVARMGLPYKKRVNVISLIVEADTNEIGALTGKLGMLPNVQVKSMLV